MVWYLIGLCSAYGLDGLASKPESIYGLSDGLILKSLWCHRNNMTSIYFQQICVLYGLLMVSFNNTKYILIFPIFLSIFISKTVFQKIIKLKLYYYYYIFILLYKLIQREKKNYKIKKYNKTIIIHKPIYANNKIRPRKLGRDAAGGTK
jgi:hypothetical protein